MIPAALAPLASHLWQSTVFAAVVALLALALRRNQARVRFWLWLAASYKFLLPFALLVSLGHLFQWRAVPAVMPPVFSAVTEVVSGPVFLTALPSSKSAPDHASVLLFVIWAAWACGFVVVAAGWVREWLRMRAIVRAASPLALALPIQVVSTSARIEPGVFGIFHPVLLLPEGIATRLTPAQLQAVLAHELCHVRRRDNLTAAIHMLVEALFWFHPLVWWLGARMMDERERACDEEVLRAGSQAQAYAETILKVCELYLESPLTCMSGVTGSDLKQRIQRIMRERFGVPLSVPKKLLLATAGFAAIAVPPVAGVLAAPRRAHATQTLEAMEAAGGKMAFDVISVRPNRSTDRPTSNIPLTLDGAYVPTGGLFHATNFPFFGYVRFAYKTNGIPPGILSRTERFDIEAKAQGNPTKDQYRLMMQSVLADRFKLAIHHETQQVPIYALVMAKEGSLGPQLKRDDGPCETPGDAKSLDLGRKLPSPSPSPGSQPPQVPCGTLMMVPASLPGRLRVAGTEVPIALLTTILPNPRSGVDRPVFDRTGLGGRFDMTIEWTPTLPTPAPPGVDSQPEPSGPTFFEAIQDQLGLKLESTTGPVDTLVIDHVEEPSEN